ncbi:MAG: OmpA family protein [Saprospiraceae bacterium]
MNKFFSLGLIIVALLFSCNINKELKDGRTAYEHKQFSVAVILLEEEYKKETEKVKKAELAYFLGESFKNNNENKSASKWYDKAVELGYGAKALYEMAYVLKKMEKYGLAARYFKEILKHSDRKKEIQKEIQKCQDALTLKNNELINDYEIAAMSFNTDASEYSPHFLEPGVLIYTSDEQSGQGKDYNWTGRGFSNIRKYNMSSSLSTDFSVVINTKDNEGSAIFDQSRNTIFFTRCFDEESDHYCKILLSKKTGQSWSEPQPVFPMDPSVNYRDPVLIENDSVLIFSCNDPKGFGGTDLYYSVLDEDNQWSTPDLMPPSINTIGDERFPTSKDDTLYFSSNYLAGIGGLDIFKTYLRSDNSWSTPENIGLPFNSSDDDFGMVFSPYKKDYVEIEGYFTSDRAGGSKDDIYHFIKRSDRKIDTTLVALEETVEEKQKELVIILNIKVFENRYAIATDPNSLILGRKPVENATILLEVNENQNQLVTDERGNALTTVESGNIYNLLVGKKDYLNNRDNFSFSDDEVNIEEGLKTFTKELVINRIYEDVEITLDDIYYDFNESFIREDAKPALDNLYIMLIDNPALNIQLSSHTDCQGENGYNEILSQKRAQSAVNYIIKKGIISTRIIAKGYGESQLALSCECEECSEDEHQLNRRTTFKII